MAQVILDKWNEQNLPGRIVQLDIPVPPGNDLLTPPAFRSDVCFNFFKDITCLYNPEKMISFNESEHTYTLIRTGEKIPSATTILKVISKPALVYWALNKAEEHVLAYFNSSAGQIDGEKLRLVLAESKKAHEIDRKMKADIGTKAHEWAEKYIKNENPAMPEDQLVLNCVLAFLDWVKTKKITFMYSEKRIYSPKYKYAGTVDFVADIEGKLFVGDFKTSKAIYPSMFYQTAAYQQALMEEMPWLKFEGNIIVRMGKDGTFEEKELCGQDNFTKNFDAFLGAKCLFDREMELGILFNGGKNIP